MIYALTIKINSDVINFCQEFPGINAFQNCGYAPIKAGSKRKYGLKMKCKCAPCAQIHHTGDDHWIMSFQDDSSDTVCCR